MLSRKVVTRSGRGFRGYFPSKKLSRHVEFESLLELDAIKLFEKSPAVISYGEQPTIIYYDQQGINKKYYPDFELILDFDRIVHIEVKPSSKLADVETAKKYFAIGQHYVTRLEHFVILTEQEIRFTHTEDIYQLLNNNNINKLEGL